MMDLIEVCKGASYIGISGHIRPDGDCAGSCMALYLYLQKVLPEAKITVYLEPSAREYHQIASIAQIDHSFRADVIHDVFFCLDTPPDRMGEAEALYQQAKKKINIDHHITNTGCGDVNLIRPEIGSCAEVIYNLIPSDMLDDAIAKALYIGMIHDTGVFQFSNTRPSTMVAAAKLMEYDIDFSNLIQESFYEKSYKQTLIMADVVSRSRMCLEGKCLIGFMDKEDMARLDAKSYDMNGIINRLKNVSGVVCAVYLYEIEPGSFKVSFRTSEKMDAAVLAGAFGGGGHVRASGCTIEGSLEQVIALILDKVSAQL